MGTQNGHNVPFLKAMKRIKQIYKISKRVIKNRIMSYGP